LCYAIEAGLSIVVSDEYPKRQPLSSVGSVAGAKVPRTSPVVVVAAVANAVPEGVPSSAWEIPESGEFDYGQSPESFPRNIDHSRVDLDIRGLACE